MRNAGRQERTQESIFLFSCIPGFLIELTQTVVAEWFIDSGKRERDLDRRATARAGNCHGMSRSASRREVGSSKISSYGSTYRLSMHLAAVDRLSPRPDLARCSVSFRSSGRIVRPGGKSRALNTRNSGPPSYSSHEFLVSMQPTMSSLSASIGRTMSSWLRASQKN
jgi:hypothetical protein